MKELHSSDEALVIITTFGQLGLHYLGIISS